MIKKNLFSVFVIAAAMTGAMVLSSCSHDEATYSEENVQQAKHAEAVAKYEKAFISLFGQPASNQSWDFTKGGSFTATRGASDATALIRWPSYSACLNGYDWKYATGENDPLRQNILASVIKKQTDEIKKLIETTANDPTKIKTWAPTGSYVFRTVASYRNVSTNKDKDKYYSIGANFGGKNNFIAMMGVKKNGKAVKNGSTGVQHTCAISFGNVPSDAVWFAVATSSKDASIVAASHPLTTYVEVTYDGRIFWGFRCDSEDDGGKYSDLILWVDKVTIDKQKIYAKRYMVEDLGGSGESDIDFNDIVFDVEQFSDGSQKCIVRALGGTLPIKIKVGNSDWWAKPEPVNKMINTQGTIDEDMVIAEFAVTGWKESENNVQVMVEDKQGFEFVTTFPENGRIPSMIAFSAAKIWNGERIPVTEEWFNTYPFEFNLDDYIQIDWNEEEEIDED